MEICPHILQIVSIFLYCPLMISSRVHNQLARLQNAACALKQPRRVLDQPFSPLELTTVSPHRVGRQLRVCSLPRPNSFGGSQSDLKYKRKFFRMPVSCQCQLVVAFDVFQHCDKLLGRWVWEPIFLGLHTALNIFSS